MSGIHGGEQSRRDYMGNKNDTNMKNLFIFLMLGSFVFLLSCKDEEPEPDPLVGIWELDDASLSIEGSSYFGFENENSFYGESSYIIEFRDDFTYEREIDDKPRRTGGTEDITDEGKWEKDGDELDLDTDDDEIEGVAYAFTIVEVDDSNLILEYKESQSIFEDAKIDEWFADGTLSSNGAFQVTQEEFDSLIANFLVQVEGVITLEFDRE